MASSTFDSDKFAAMKQPSGSGRGVKQQSQLISNKHEFVSSLDKIKNASVKDLLLILQKEHESKTQLENMLIGLQEDNTKLKSQVSFLKSKVEQQQHQIVSTQKKSTTANNNTSSLNRTLLDDDKALEIIELTLHKYQQFLDFLRNAGFGKLIEYSEINNQEPRSTTAKSGVIRSSKSSSKKTAYKSLSKSPSKSPTTRTDEQRYYASKINKTKAKTMDNMTQDDSYQFYGNDNSNSTLMNYEGPENNVNIDTLLSNALEISRSYRRMNSSSLSNSTLLHNANHHHRATNQDMLSEIKEGNRETSRGSLTLHTKNDDSVLPNIDELQKTTETLLEQYKNIRSQTTEAQPLVTTSAAAAVVLSNEKKKKSSSKKQAINSVSLSPGTNNKNGDFGNNVFLFADNLQEVSAVSNSEPNQQVNNLGKSQASSTSPATTVIVNKHSGQPPAVSARSINSNTSNSNTKKVSSISEHVNDEENEDDDAKFTDNEEEEEEEGEEKEEEKEYVNRNVFIKKSNGKGTSSGRSNSYKENFDKNGIESFDEDNDDF